jgi:hypothetical protein
MASAAIVMRRRSSARRTIVAGVTTALAPCVDRNPPGAARSTHRRAAPIACPIIGSNGVGPPSVDIVRRNCRPKVVHATTLTLRVPPARIDATRARHQCCATHERHTTHEDLNLATSNGRIHALSSAVLTLTVRALEE